MLRVARGVTDGGDGGTVAMGAGDDDGVGVHVCSVRYRATKFGGDRFMHSEEIRGHECDTLGPVIQDEDRHIERISDTFTGPERIRVAC